MPIYLPAPPHNPKGPDGQGHNRLEILTITSDQCALRPRSYAALWESQDTRRARYGPFGPCIREGKCDTCPIFKAAPQKLDAFTDRVLVRLQEHRTEHGITTRPWLMNNPEHGWASYGYPWTWDRIARIDGWTLGRSYKDADGESFWLLRPNAGQRA